MRKRRSASSISSSCRISSCTRRPSAPTSSCPRRHSPRRKARSRTRNGACSVCARRSSRHTWRVPTGGSPPSEIGRASCREGRDWSSGVCSSDLCGKGVRPARFPHRAGSLPARDGRARRRLPARGGIRREGRHVHELGTARAACAQGDRAATPGASRLVDRRRARSEERRVGKGGTGVQACALPIYAEKAFGQLDFLIVQDLFLHETAERADVFLPAAAFAEKEGTFTNSERRVQRVRKAIEPPHLARPDWWIAAERDRKSVV